MLEPDAAEHGGIPVTRAERPGAAFLAIRPVIDPFSRQPDPPSWRPAGDAARAG